MSRSVDDKDSDFEDISWMENPKNKEPPSEDQNSETLTPDSDSQNEIFTNNNETSNDSKSPEYFNPQTLIEDDVFSQTKPQESPILKSHQYDLFVHVLNKNHQNKVVETLASLPEGVTGFSKDEFVTQFKDEPVIKLAYLSLYEASLIKVKLIKYDIKIQVLERSIPHE